LGYDNEKIEDCNVTSDLFMMVERANSLADQKEMTNKNLINRQKSTEVGSHFSSKLNQFK